jgi:basic membrane protein A
MSMRSSTTLALLIITSLILSACAPAEPKVFSACQVTDVGGIDDKSFNQFAWIGFEAAAKKHGIDIKFLESQEQADYEVNINTFLEEDCDLIVAVGFMINDASVAAAEVNPDATFAGIDCYWGEKPNYRGSFYDIHEGTFLLGYLAAGMTETGTVGTYGGVQDPVVTAFSDGFYLGVMAYNEAHGTNVTVLGWDPEIEGGLFTGDFENTDNGRTMGETLLDAGADIIMPVAGPVGAGTLAVLEERGTGLLVGVDTDWSAFYPEQADYILASALKRMDLFVVDTVDMMLDGTFEGGQFIASLENGRVGIAYGSALEDKIPNDLKAEIDDIASKIISGEISAAYPRGE